LNQQQIYRAAHLDGEEGALATAGTEIAATQPAIVTFEPVNVLVRRTVPVGIHYRDALLRWTGLMLPRPDVFEKAYQEVYAKAEIASSRFGAGTETLEAWWRRIVLEVYNTVVTCEFYDEDELELVETNFDNVFRELYDSIMVGTDVWQMAPDVSRLLAALREWRDLGGGPRIGIVSTQLDDRVSKMLHSVFEIDQLEHTFDFIIGNSDPDASAFEKAAALRKQIPTEQCVHVVPFGAIPPSADCPVITVASAATDVSTDGIRLLDLLDTWNLSKQPEDDLITTTRLYSVYDEHPDSS